MLFSELNPFEKYDERLRIEFRMTRRRDEVQRAVLDRFGTCDLPRHRSYRLFPSPKQAGIRGVVQARISLDDGRSWCSGYAWWDGEGKWDRKTGMRIAVERAVVKANELKRKEIQKK